MSDASKMREIGHDGKSPIFYDYDCPDVIAPTVKFKGGIRARHLPSGEMGYITGQEYKTIEGRVVLRSCRLLFDYMINNKLSTPGSPGGYFKTEKSQVFRSDEIRHGGTWYGSDYVETMDSL